MAFLRMARLVLKWSWKQPVTSQYPFVRRVPLAGSRGKLIFLNDACVYCEICKKKCPTQALEVNRKAKTWSIDRLRCIHCGACVEGCPKKSLGLAGDHVAPTSTKTRESR